MDSTSYVVVGAAGVVAGAVNALAGAGSLLTYPVLVAVGLSPVAANVTNDVGVLPGNVSGVIALRRGLHGQRSLLRDVVPRVVVGALVGAVLLLAVPGAAFAWAAPPLLFAASVLTLIQPILTRRRNPATRGRRSFHRILNVIAVYGGYFGTGIGLLFMATLGLFVDESAQRLNSVKNVLQMLANGLAGVLFAFVAPVHWTVAVIMAAGSLTGGQVGAWTSTRVPSSALRIVVAVVGIGASTWLLARQL